METITAIATIQFISPYSQSKYIDIKKDSNETHESFEDRIWRERMNYDDQDYIYIPAMAFKHMLVSASAWLNKKIPGQKNKTYTKRFKSGVLVLENMILPYKKEEVPCETLFVPSDGKPGGGSRVKKNFPYIPLHRTDKKDNSLKFETLIIDKFITEDVFHEHLITAGQFIGLGRFRPENNGTNGRFVVNHLDWQEN